MNNIFVNYYFGTPDTIKSYIENMVPGKFYVQTDDNGYVIISINLEGFSRDEINDTITNSVKALSQHYSETGTVLYEGNTLPANGIVYQSFTIMSDVDEVLSSLVEDGYLTIDNVAEISLDTRINHFNRDLEEYKNNKFKLLPETLMNSIKNFSQRFAKYDEV